MRALLIGLLINLPVFADADISDCLKDAKTFANHEHAVNPIKACASVIKNLKEKVEAKVTSYHAYGVDHMLYLENAGSTQELLAGDQTELKKISKIQLYPEENRILVLQPGSVATFRLNFIGNVTPLFHNKHPELQGAGQVRLSEDELIASHPESGSIVIFNADGDSRKIGKKKPEVKRHLSGPRTQLHKPVDFDVLSKQKILIVLDEDRLLVFPILASGNTPPKKVLNLGTEGATSLKLEADLLVIHSPGKEQKVSLDQLK